MEEEKRKSQRAPNPPEFVQPRLSRSNGGHPQREGRNLVLFVSVRLVLRRCEATNLGVFDLCLFDLLKWGCAIRVGLELAGKKTPPPTPTLSALLSGGHLKSVTLKPVSRIFCIFRVLVSAFYAFLVCGVSCLSEIIVV